MPKQRPPQYRLDTRREAARMSVVSVNFSAAKLKASSLRKMGGGSSGLTTGRAFAASQIALALLSFESP